RCLDADSIAIHLLDFNEVPPAENPNEVLAPWFAPHRRQVNVHGARPCHIRLLVTSADGSEYTIHVNYLIDYKDRVLHLRRGLQRPQSPRSQVSIVSAPSFAGSP